MKRKGKIKKSFWQRMLYSHLVIVFGIVIIALFSVGISKKVFRQHQINNEVAQLKQEIESLEKNNQELFGLIDYLKSDDFLESEARTKLGLKKDGEKVVIVSSNYEVVSDIASSNLAVNIPILKSIKTSEQKNSQKWLSYFFSK